MVTKEVRLGVSASFNSHSAIKQASNWKLPFFSLSFLLLFFSPSTVLFTWKQRWESVAKGEPLGTDGTLLQEAFYSLSYSLSLLSIFHLPLFSSCRFSQGLSMCCDDQATAPPPIHPPPTLITERDRERPHPHSSHLWADAGCPIKDRVLGRPLACPLGVGCKPASTPLRTIRVVFLGLTPPSLPSPTCEDASA